MDWYYTAILKLLLLFSPNFNLKVTKIKHRRDYLLKWEQKHSIVINVSLDLM